MTWLDHAEAVRPELVLGQVRFRGRSQQFGLLGPDRLRHIYVLGSTGVGKSTLLERIAIQDIQAGRGLAVIDPHGSLISALLPHIPKWRLEQTLLIDPADTARPIAFNIFRRGAVPAANTSLLASQILSVFKARWGEFWGPRLEHILRMGLLATAEHPEATLLLLYQMLTDEAVRERMLRHVTDPVVQVYWTREFPSYSKALRAEALSPILNKLGALLATQAIRPMVAGVRSRIDWTSLMQERAIVLADLSVGRIGEDAAHLLGSLLVSSIQLAAFSRTGTPVPFALMLDEFQHAVTGSIPTVLSEARKYGLSLVLAHQYLGQVPSSIRDAIVGNVGTMLLLRLGGADADTLAPEVAPQFTGADLQHLPRYHMIARMTAGGGLLDPFLGTTLAPLRGQGDVTREQLAATSFARFGCDPVATQAGIRRALKV